MNFNLNLLSTKLILVVFTSIPFLSWSHGLTEKSRNLRPILLTSFENSKDTITPSFYIISGSFLIPSNAANRKNELARLGFKNVYIKNFSDSEYYSVVVDHFSDENKAIQLGEKLRGLNQAFFIKNTGLIPLTPESK